jgi:hypothetical protein
MSYATLSIGSKGKEVELLQTLLNEKVKREYRAKIMEDIKVNGTFDTHTKTFVKDFQLAAFLKKDGTVGKKTWAALLGTEMFNCYDQPFKQVPATSDYDCWAASTGTLLNQSACNRTQPAGVDFQQLGGGIIGGIENSHANMKKFADYHGMQMLEGGNMTCTQICYLVYNFGRLMINVRGITSRLKKGSPNDSHLMMILGVRGDGTPNGTTVKFYEPTSDTTIVESYQFQKNRFPQMTYQVFYMLNNYSQPVF